MFLKSPSGVLRKTVLKAGDQLWFEPLTGKVCFRRGTKALLMNSEVSVLCVDEHVGLYRGENPPRLQTLFDTIRFTNNLTVKEIRKQNEILKRVFIFKIPDS